MKSVLFGIFDRAESYGQFGVSDAFRWPGNPLWTRVETFVSVRNTGLDLEEIQDGVNGKIFPHPRHCDGWCRLADGGDDS
jgi:hypothetical protein